METITTDMIPYGNLATWWAGGFYLLNKIFFSQAERCKVDSKKRVLKIFGWAVYLVGLPAWCYLFYWRKDSIAFYVEISGAVIMILGLIVAWIGIKKTPKWFVVIGFVAVGIGMKYSFQDFGIMQETKQWLELGISIGFLAGTLLLALERRSGYLWFVFMNISCALLMGIEHKSVVLTVQQIVSLYFVYDAWRHFRPSVDSIDERRNQ
ncbi:hypothetical protein HON36_02815 [Candidatus Parcubacteria bacterium]|jgi:hypothetical protein|nr:hypothetical protein [Candidatus Parcubacteria bacterium]MBT7228554.1 hypothetical protein [Candidatus Parcubacteria bacterium]